MHSVASEAPDLFLVSADLPTAEHVLTSFARRQGGPGTIALTPDPADAGAAAAVAEPDGGQDLVLPRSFSEADLRSAVARILSTGDRPARRPTDEPKLTSQDIFGDLVAEVEREARESSPRRAPSPPPKPPTTPAAPSAPGPRPPAAPRSIDDDLERKLEQTVSGVLGPSARRSAASRPPATPPAAPGAPSLPQAPKPGPKPAPKRQSDDVDKLISDTLFGLREPATPKRRPAPADDDPFDLSELEAILDRPRKPRTSAPAPPAP
jgi:hypothetical protein